MVKEEANIHVSKEKVQSHGQALDQIKASTGITDVEELVKTFVADEDQNFSLFNYVKRLRLRSWRSRSRTSRRRSATRILNHQIENLKQKMTSKDHQP